MISLALRFSWLNLELNPVLSLVPFFSTTEAISLACAKVGPEGFFAEYV